MCRRRSRRAPLRRRQGSPVSRSHRARTETEEPEKSHQEKKAKTTKSKQSREIRQVLADLSPVLRVPACRARFVYYLSSGEPILQIARETGPWIRISG